MREKEAKARLEARIASMQSQLLVGGAALEETPVFRRAALVCEEDCLTRFGSAGRIWPAAEDRLMPLTPCPHRDGLNSWELMTLFETVQCSPHDGHCAM